jgi:membrane-associated phospholipid phosphatase
MRDRQERIAPFILISILYSTFTYLFFARYGVSLNDNIFKLMLIIDLLVLVATVITFFYKVSVHSLAIWGLLGIIIPLNRVSENNTLFIPTIVILLLAGLIMSSRLQLQAHNPREVLVGTLVGFMTSFTSMYILF